MIEFVMMIGLPGCGKSTIASKMKGYVVVSSDKIREEFYGDENVQTDPGKVFGEAKKRIVRCINAEKNVILDATNVKRKERMNFIKDIKNQIKKDVEVKFVAIWVAVPFETCVMRNNSRERVVPEEVIMKMMKNFTPPGPDEGFDEIKLEFANSDFKGYIVDDFLDFADSYDQKNIHHTLTLGHHCRKAAEIVAEHPDYSKLSLLYDVALIHDCGKPCCAAPKVDKEGNETGEYSYHQHHCTGSYDAVFYLKNLGYRDEQCIYGARLVGWHMRPLLEWKNDKTRQKDCSLLEPWFVKDLMVLHDGDVNAH